MKAISAPKITRNAPSSCRQGDGSPHSAPAFPASRFSRHLAGLVAVLSVVGVTAQAAVIQYDGSTLPTAEGAPWYTLNLPGPYNLHGVKFANTAWSSTGGVLTMTTYPVQGIWLGNTQFYQGNVNTNWDVSTSAMGSDYSARMRLPTGAKEWSFYINDRAYGAGFYLDFNLLRYGTPAGQQTVPFDGTQFHTYGILLKGGLVEYTLDGTVLYAGPASASTNPWGFLIGDGSGSTPTGAGSLEVDWINMDTAPTRNVVPEPATLVLLGITPLAMLRRRRKTPQPG